MLKPWLLCCGVLIAGSAGADTLWLKNGDRLTGKILFMDTRSVTFRSTAAGKVVIKRKKIRSLSTSARLQVDWGDGQTTTAKLSAGEDDTVILDDGTVLPLRQLNHLVRPRSTRQDWQWEGRLNLFVDLEQDASEETENFKGTFDTRLFNLTWRHQAKGEYEYETENDEQDERNYTLEYDLDYFVARPWFLRLNSRTERDYFNYNQRTQAYGIGPGYQFRDSEQGSFHLNLQYTRYRLALDPRIDGVKIPLRFTVDAVALGWDFTQAWLAPDLELYSNGQLVHPHQVNIEHILDSESGLRLHLNSNLNLSLRLEYDQVKQDLATNTDRRILFGAGIKW